MTGVGVGDERVDTGSSDVVVPPDEIDCDGEGEGEAEVAVICL